MKARPLVIAALVVSVLGLAAAVFALTQQSAVEGELAQAEARTDALQDVLEQTQGVNLDVLTGAIDEGRITWYSAAPVEASSLQAETFMDRYPFINVELFRQTGGPLGERFMADVQRGDNVADVILHSDPAQFDAWAEEGLIAEYVPAAAEALPDSLRQFEPYGYPDRLVVLTLTYNGDRVTEEQERVIHEKGWEALADPVFENQVVMVDPALTGSAFNMWYILIQEWGEERVRALLEGIADNGALFYESNVPAAGAISSGEALIGPIIEGIGIDQVMLSAPVRMAWPDPLPAYYGVVGVVADAPNPNAAKLFTEWFMSEAGQRAWVQNYNIRSGHPAVPDTRAHTQTDWYEALELKPTLERFVFADDLNEQTAARDTVLGMFDDVFGQRQ